MSDNRLIDFGKRIKSLREKNSLSINELAFLVGISPTYLVSIESGEKTPDIVSISLFSQVLNVSLDYLLNGKEKSSESSFTSLSKKFGTMVKAYEQVADEHYCNSPGSFLTNCLIAATLSLFKEKVSEKKLLSMIYVGKSLSKYGHFPLNANKVFLPIKKDDLNEENHEVVAFCFGVIAFYNYSKDEIDEFFRASLQASLIEFDEIAQGVLLGYIFPKDSALKNSKNIIYKNRNDKTMDSTRIYLENIFRYVNGVSYKIDRLQESVLDNVDEENIIRLLTNKG
ncbi:MAG: helix-turn-helix transcriptional regulator [Bacilli bacterium]|nr:helix-turn-helix transcriptional regulator [Bacilli bacterium]MDY6430832.1 helix-turn-helix transcriptional regulator [Bacilli bacterium]